MPWHTPVLHAALGNPNRLLNFADSSAGYSPRVPSPDKELIENVEKAFARGDDNALRAAYEQHAGLVYTLCRRALDESRAKDVTQEVFISAWKSHRRYDPGKGTLAGWLIAIAKNRIIDNVRAERKHSERRSREDFGAVAVEADVERIGDALMIAEALRCLSDRARKVISMHYFEDLTLRQIAERTSSPLGTVKSDLRRGLSQMRRQLESTHE